MDYGKKSKISFTVWSCPQVATAVVEPYNTVLCVHSLLEHTDVTIMYVPGQKYFSGRNHISPIGHDRSAKTEWPCFASTL